MHPYSHLQSEEHISPWPISIVGTMLPTWGKSPGKHEAGVERWLVAYQPFLRLLTSHSEWVRTLPRKTEDEAFVLLICPHCRDGQGEVSWSLIIRPVGAQVPVPSSLDSDLCAPYLCVSFSPITAPFPHPTHSQLLKTTALNSCSGKVYACLPRSWLGFSHSIPLCPCLQREGNYWQRDAPCVRLWEPRVHIPVSGRTPPSRLRKI